MERKNKPLVSIVIPCFNSKNLINSCLASLFNQSFSNFEIVLVDDCSSDGTVDSIKPTYLKSNKLRILQNSQNSGPSRCRNICIKKSRGKYVAFFETDMQADKHWLSNMVSEFERDPNLGAAHSRVMDLKKKKFIQADGMKMIPFTGWVVMRNYGLTPAQSDSTQEDVIIGSVGTFVRRKILLQIGGFDEKLGHKVDDIDLGWRIWLAGYKTVNLPQSIAYHWGGKPQAVRSISSLKSEIYFNRMPRVFLKNYEIINLFKFLPWLLILHFVRGIKHLFTGNPQPFIGYVISLAKVMYELPDTLRQRSKIQSSRKISDKELIERVMISNNLISTWNHYVIPTHQTAARIFS